jgi:SAM-dependent methyltransferase
MSAETEPIAHSRANALQFFERYTTVERERLAGKTVVDLSAGTGYIAHLFENAGSHVQVFDLVPEQNRYAHTRCQFIDLQKEFPISTGSVDVAVCAETLEHLPNQFFFFQEVARILKPGGTLLLTTPNTSSLRSRLAQFAMESEHYGHAAPNELDAYVEWGGGRYFGKLFLSGLLRIRTLAAINKLQLVHSHPAPASSTSVLLLVTYPLLWILNYRVLQKQVRHEPTHAGSFKQIFRYNLSLRTLLNKHLLLEFRKQ